MAWTEATRERYRRAPDDRQDDLTVPARGRMGRPRATDPRRVFDALRSLLSSGCRWRLIPPCHLPFSTVRNDFATRAFRNGCWMRFAALARAQAGIIDSQSVKTTESGGPSGYDAGKKIRGRKRHIAVDVEGSPIVVHGHPADVQGAPDLMVDLLEEARGVSKVFADGGYRG